MLLYIKSIQLYLLIIISILFNSLSTTSFAHEIKPSIADFYYDENYLNFEIRLNAELILSNIDASKITNTNSSPLSKIYDEYRLLDKNELEKILLESWEKINPNIEIKINNKLTNIDLVKVETQNLSNFEISRDSLIFLKIPLNQNSDYFTFKWLKNYGPIILRENNDLKLENDLFTKYLQSGVEADKIFFKENNFRSNLVSFMNFFVLGIQHIIPKGLDHILFIFGLFLFSSSINKLVKQITIFTIAHSVTLIFVSLSVIKINSNIVEPVIALSIVYVGVENIFKNYIKEYLRYIVILFFGLLHGLGFALVLSDIGYRSSKLYLNLISFNIGIEVAQISLILFLYLLVGIKFAKNQYYRIVFQLPSSIFIASIGLYWFFERINFYN